MSGPRDLRRGSKIVERVDPAAAIGTKSHYVIERWGSGYAITIKRRGAPVETILCPTEAEANRTRRQLSDDGLIGYVGGAR